MKPALTLFVLGCVAALTAPLVLAGAQPAAALRLRVAPQTLRSDRVTLVWEKPETGGAPAEYQVYGDGTLLATTARTHWTVQGLRPEQSRIFWVVSRGREGGVAAESNRIEVRTPSPEPVASVEAFGAKGDGQTLNTRAIQAAIDACPPHGVVRIPPGVFRSGALFLKSDLTLEVAAGAVLKGSTDAADYEPFIPSRFEGWELMTYASLVNAGQLNHAGPCTVHNLSIRGEGTISGGGDALAKAMIAAHGLRSRGRLICLANCREVEIQGLTLEESPCWTLHYIYSENVSLHDLTVNSTVLNGDGIDPDSSVNSDIFHCRFDNGDDCIAIKSGKNPEGNTVNRPTEHVRIADCQFLRGHGISIGSETSGGIRDVRVEDCVAGNLLNGMQVKSTKDRGNVVEAVLVRDCDLQKISILTELAYNNDGAPAPEQSEFRDFRFVNLDLRQAPTTGPVILVNGFPAEGHRTKRVRFENLQLPAGAVVSVDRCEDVTFAGVVTTDATKPQFKVTRSERIAY